MCNIFVLILEFKINFAPNFLIRSFLMETIYIVIVAILLALAVLGLVVGVSNDAVNFLNSAIGSKAASRRVIFSVASIGILVGVLTSNGMMEVARSGVFYPEMFTFREVMMLFLGVMFANVILLDLFNTFGLPTSTTVSLVFGLLGAAVAVTSLKIKADPELTAADMSQFINSGKTLVIISGILMSVAIAFVVGAVVMFVSRLIFTFHYHKMLRRFGALWCGIAFTAIAYFALFKGLRDSGLLGPEFFEMISDNLLLVLAGFFVLSSAVMFVLQLAKVNILKVTILAGTFSLALAFAGNDLVNFIGVPLAGYDSYKLAVAAGGNDAMSMGGLNAPVVANHAMLLLAGLIMIVTLWMSKKAQSVSDTEINLAKQDEGTERFGSSLFSRSVVRVAVTCNRWYEDYAPKSLQRAINRRFIPLQPKEKGGSAHFDLIRATVNLTVASILIASATSLQLPLSTTYVTFMVAMGSSLADKAWGRESAVYRITGVITVIAGWFVTALIAFVIALLVTYLLMWGGTWAVIVMLLLCVGMFIQSSLTHKRRVAKERKTEELVNASGNSSREVIRSLVAEISDVLTKTTEIYSKTIKATLDEDRKTLREMVRESNDLFYNARERKYAMLPTLQKLEDNYIEAGYFYVQVVDYISEMSKALIHITRPCFEHIDNNHKGMSEEQVKDLLAINDKVSGIYASINAMLNDNDYSDTNVVLEMRDDLFVMIDDAVKSQLRRIQNKATSTKASMLYLTILNETKNMVLQSRNLLKSQRSFMENQFPSAK